MHLGRREIEIHKWLARVLLAVNLLTYPAAAAPGSLTISGLTRGIALVASALFGLALLWGATKIMFSGGDQRLIEEGKNHIKNAALGLILALIASAIPSITGGLNLHPLVIIP